MELDPKDDVVHSYYGDFLDDHDRYTEALVQFENATVLDPDDAVSYVTIAIQILNRGLHS